MTYTRKKLLLREDEAEMIELALTELMKRLEQAEKEHRAMEIFAFSAADKACCRRAAEKGRGVIAEVERILKLVRGAEATETADLIERLEKEKADAQWVPATERLPEDGQDVLCWYEYFRYGEYNAMFKAYGIGYQYFGNWGGEVSHGTNAHVLAWLPLPKAPEVERTERA